VLKPVQDAVSSQSTDRVTRWRDPFFAAPPQALSTTTNLLIIAAGRIVHEVV
jgi:hypothetical protein